MQILQRLLPVLLLSLCPPPAGAEDHPATLVTGLRCEGHIDPLGLDIPRPRLGWRMETDRNGAAQTAYQIEVDGAWDSGRVASDASVAIPYAGTPLASGKTYSWRVRLWDEQGRPTAWSAPARWTMGKLAPSDWSARWIAAPADIPPAVEGVEIVRATYRTLDGKVEVDVTPSVRKLIGETRLPFPVEPGLLGGDPALYVVKELVVDYTLRGEPGRSRARDFERLCIPAALPGVPAPWFRGEFELAARPSAALVTVNTPAYFELHVNGVKAGEDVLMPAVSDSRDRTFAVTYDVARLLKPGKNCLGVWAARGWADQLVLRAQLDAVVDGKAFSFGTGPHWLSRPGNISHIGGWSWHNFGGEHLDAGRCIEGWAAPGLDPAGWVPVVEADAPAGAAAWHDAPSNRIGETIAPVSITPLAEGRYEIDFGRNLTGWLRLKTPGLPAGRLVRMHFADHLFPDGVQASPIGNIAISGQSCVDFPRVGGGHNSYQTYRQTSEFVSSGRPGDEFRNRFNYAGFRYVVVEGLERAPTKEDAAALLVESDLSDAGSFDCSDPLLNRIHEVNRWTQRCLNLGAYYVDCPTRERMGYGDGQVAVTGMMMNFDAGSFYAKWVRDWRLALDMRRGYLPYVAPPFEKGGGGPPWPGGIARIPWQHYLHYGDPAVLEENLGAARKYCEYLDRRASNDVLRAWGGGFSFIGDWVPPGRGMDTRNWPDQAMAELFCNCFRVHLWRMVERMSAALGRAPEAEHARARATAIAAATHAAFYDAASRRYVIDEQIYYAFPLLAGVTPESERAAVLDNLVRCIVEKNKGHLDTGMLGTLLLIEYLQEIGRDDLILGMYQKKDHPGWGYMVEQGATTMWEQWNGHWSQIHSCFTSADNWLYQGLAGIRPDPAKPGFKNVIIKPAAVGDITWARARHDGPYGRITVEWNRSPAGEFTLAAVVPPNSSATAILPDGTRHEAGPGRHFWTARVAPPGAAGAK
ncbi:MAG: family 78 glycoside hydrolase catalytic domain [Kiritimatiellia bacterium]